MPVGDATLLILGFLKWRSDAIELNLTTTVMFQIENTNAAY